MTLPPKSSLSWKLGRTSCFCSEASCLFLFCEGFMTTPKSYGDDDAAARTPTRLTNEEVILFLPLLSLINLSWTRKCVCPKDFLLRLLFPQPSMCWRFTQNDTRGIEPRGNRWFLFPLRSYGDVKTTVAHFKFQQKIESILRAETKSAALLKCWWHEAIKNHRDLIRRSEFVWESLRDWRDFCYSITSIFEGLSLRIKATLDDVSPSARDDIEMRVKNRWDEI